MRKVTFSPEALEQLNEWKRSSKKITARIIMLIMETATTPFSGTGNPKLTDPAKPNVLSRGIYRKNHLIYEVKDDGIFIISCRCDY